MIANSLEAQMSIEEGRAVMQGGLGKFELERRDWPAAAALSEPAIGFPLERFPWAEAMIAYARPVLALRA
jgi:hypothetical protein